MLPLFPAFRRVRLKDKETEQLQSNVVQALQPLLKSPIIDGVHLKDVALASGSNDVNHGLGRPIEGWIVTNRSGTATVHSTGSNYKTLTLVASADVTVSIWVF